MKLPETAQDLAELLRRQALHYRTILLEGNGTKRQMAGPVEAADECISTGGLNRVLDYQPRDLTISVEAGVPWRDLTALLAQNRQMAPLDPPFADGATVGGVVAANCSGPRRRLYGTARDMVIGMQFATLGGKLVESGGMVLRNVAGLDMAKLLIGSFGTLAAITVVNFKLTGMPEVEKTLLAPFGSAREAISARDRILAGGLLPAALDLLNPQAAQTVAEKTWLLAVRAGGNAAATRRYQEHPALRHSQVLEDGPQGTLWRQLEEFTPQYLAGRPNGVVVRASCTLKELENVVASFEGPAVARAGSGVCYGYFERPVAAAEWLDRAMARNWKAVIEFAGVEDKPGLNLWPSPGGDFEIMQRVKHLFDPGIVLNRGRLYRLI
ncbi:MAG TPA: FAD-binding oxidoreductase [Bryobacteraceae bacterium]|nr:FAD-binding oxidoreductase [Bryobacteraceae bacterium]